MSNLEKLLKKLESEKDSMEIENYLYVKLGLKFFNNASELQNVKLDDAVKSQIISFTVSAILAQHCHAAAIDKQTSYELFDAICKNSKERLDEYHEAMPVQKEDKH
jgi:hypothetical protein